MFYSPRYYNIDNFHFSLQLSFHTLCKVSVTDSDLQLLHIHNVTSNNIILHVLKCNLCKIGKCNDDSLATKVACYF